MQQVLKQKRLKTELTNFVPKGKKVVKLGEISKCADWWYTNCKFDLFQPTQSVKNVTYIFPDSISRNHQYQLDLDSTKFYLISNLCKFTNINELDFECYTIQFKAEEKVNDYFSQWFNVIKTKFYPKDKQDILFGFFLCVDNFLNMKKTQKRMYSIAKII